MGVPQNGCCAVLSILKWKQLPSNIQQAKTKSEFKSMLTDDVLENVKI